MADTNFVDNSLPVVPAAWFNDLNVLAYRALGSTGLPGGMAPGTPGQILINLGANGGAAGLLAFLNALLGTSTLANAALGDLGTNGGGPNLTAFLTALGSAAAATGATLIFYNQGGTGAVTRTLQAREQDIVSAKDFGATGNGSTDDTAAIQAGINYCRTNRAVLWFPFGTYLISVLDCTAATGLILRGTGRGGTIFMPKAGTAAYGTATGHLFDCSGSRFLNFEDFQVGAFNQTPVPTTCFFLAQTAGNPSNYIFFKNVYATGKYTVATFYNTSVESSRVLDCAFYNYQPAAVSTLYFSKNNIAALSSAFVTIIASTLAPNDWTFLGNEVHDFTNNAGGQALNFDQVGTLRFYGGNISANSNAGQYGSLQNGCSNLLFSGTTFYSDTGPAPNFMFNNVGGLTGLTMDQCSQQYNTAFFTGTGAFKAGSSARQINFHSTLGTPVAANSTFYLGVNGHDAAETNSEIIMAHPGLISNLNIQTSASPGGAQTYTFTMRKNGVSQTITCSQTASAVSSSDTTHFYQVATGDQISLQMATSATANTTQVTAAFDFMALS